MKKAIVAGAMIAALILTACSQTRSPQEFLNEFKQTAIEISKLRQKVESGDNQAKEQRKALDEKFKKLMDEGDKIIQKLSGKEKQDFEQKFGEALGILFGEDSMGENDNEPTDTAPTTGKVVTNI